MLARAIAMPLPLPDRFRSRSTPGESDWARNAASVKQPDRQASAGSTPLLQRRKYSHMFMRDWRRHAGLSSRPVERAGERCHRQGVALSPAVGLRLSIVIFLRAACCSAIPPRCLGHPSILARDRLAATRRLSTRLLASCAQALPCMVTGRRPRLFSPSFHLCLYFVYPTGCFSLPAMLFWPLAAEALE